MMAEILMNYCSDSQALEVWLDLEGTVINNWDDGLFIQHVSKIKDYLQDVKPTFLNIWSFAIWTQKEKEEFDYSGMKERIEQCFGLPIIEYPSVDEMMVLCKPYEFLFNYTCPLEFMQINGKYFSFLKHAMSQTSKKMVLIDDCVPGSVIQYTNKNVEVETLNIETDL
jgi:hypothetical protein